MANMEIICQGWLTKSPPERKLHGLLATFRKAKWRRRYFVLHKPASSLPDVYALDYFRDASLAKRVSHVDLEQCEQVIASLESAFYQYLFSIRTKQKGRDRTYYLAAGTEEEMTRWVECLCHVCGLKQEDEASEDIPQQEAPAPPPPDRIDSIPVMVTPIKKPEEKPTTTTRATGNSSPVDDKGYIPLDECTSGTNSQTENGNLAFSNKENRDSIASIPDAPPPPPPEKGMSADDMGTYDLPPMRVVTNSRESQDLYNVPPVRTVTRRHTEKSTTDSCYDVPPTRIDSVRTSSSSGYRTSGETYDVPPPRRSPIEDTKLLDASPRPRSHTFNDDFSRARSQVQSDTYDYPPIRSRSERDISSERDEVVSPPPRPPKPTSPLEHNKVSLESRPAVGRSFFPSNTSSLYDIPPLSGGRSSVDDFDDVYDFPKPLASDSEQAQLARSPPPPPQACPPPSGVKPHRYVNAATGYVVSENDPSVHSYINSPPPGGVMSKMDNNNRSYLDTVAENTMNRLNINDPDVLSHSDTSSTGSVELNRSIPAPPRHQSLVMAGYADMNQQYTPMSDQLSAYSVPPPSKNRTVSQGSQGAFSVPPPARNGVYTPMNSGQSAYTVLPSGPSRPVPSRSSSVMSALPPRSGYRRTDLNQAGDLADTYSCNIIQTPRTRSFKKKSPSMPVRTVKGPYPPPVNHVLLPQKMKAAQSSSESESGSEDEGAMMYDSLPSKSRRPLSQTPPPPPPNKDPKLKGEIQYLDLDLYSSSSKADKVPTQAHSPPPGGASPTEYKEIDFVRTAALCETMRDVESSRRSSDKTDG